MADNKGDHEKVVEVLENSTNSEHDPHYDPIIELPEVAISTNEEDEVELIKIRAKLFRYDSSEEPHEWKERGTGDIKLLRHTIKNSVRVVMRRDKTLKICANHFITPFMELRPNCGSDRAWVYSVLADFADESPKAELLALKFATAENAKKWKDAFEEAKMIVETQCEIYAKFDHSNSLLEESRESDEDKTKENVDEDDDDEDRENVDDDKENVDTDDKENVVTEKQQNLAAELSENLAKLNVTTQEGEKEE